MISYFNFNVEKMFLFVEGEINKFAKNHETEQFYAFAIDEGLLCLNSLTEFEKTLNKYQNESKAYNKEEEINDLKYNTGDWEYQGFSTLNEAPGYNYRLYKKFYNIGFYGEIEQQKTTKYYLAMEKLIKNLKENGAFKNLQTTEDFKMFITTGND